VSWDAIAAVGELLGAAGVIASLLYLASHLRQNTEAVKASAAADAASSMRDVVDPVLVSPEASGLIARGFDDPGALEPSERAWAINMVFNLLRAWETLHFQFLQGHADRETFESYERLYLHYFHSPLVSEYWAMRESLFTPRFVAYVNRLGAPHDGAKRYKELGVKLGERAKKSDTGKATPAAGETKNG